MVGAPLVPSHAPAHAVTAAGTSLASTGDRPGATSDLHTAVEAAQRGRADAGYLHELLDAAEGPGLVPVGNDSVGQHRPDPWKLLELSRTGGVQVQRRAPAAPSPARQRGREVAPP